MAQNGVIGGRAIIDAHLKQRVQAVPHAVPKDGVTPFATPQDIVLTDDHRDLFSTYVVQVEPGAMPFRVRVDPPTVFHPGSYYEHVTEDASALWVYAPTR